MIGILILWLLSLTVLFLKIYLSLQKISKGSTKETVVDILSEVLEKEQKLEKDFEGAKEQVKDLIFDSQLYIQRIGLVRFNPFNDTGGDQSFILALLNAEDSGVVISGLHTRNGTRWYAKKIEHGKGVEHELSEDELKAIKQAAKK